ncbi:hypothetical protein GBA52_024845 [Prunus armeniaca]|nr:hypothetical protein GBA52_024845 [Prunus armeniaca]
MYIFGHQPPNIDGNSVELEKETDTYVDANTSISDPREDTSLDQKMDLMEAQAQAVSVDASRD